MLKRTLCIICIVFLSSAAVRCRNADKTRQPERAAEETRELPNTATDEFANIKLNIYDNDKVPNDVEVIRDIEYGKSGKTSLKLNIVYPKKKTTRPLPSIVWIHGGGWESGSKDDQTGMLAGYAQQGYFCASIDYRLINEAVFPAQLEDCKTAVRFVRANAAKYNVDPDRIGAWGASAGGHLAALLGTTGGIKELEGTGGSQEFPSNVQAVCDWFGPVSFDSAALPPDNSISRLIGGTPQDNKEKSLKADPATYITKDDPPILIMHGDKDTTVPYELSKLFYSSLKNAGVDADLKIVSGAGHWFTNIEQFQSVLDFFNKQLKK